MKLKLARPIQYLSERWEKQPAVAWSLSILWLIGISWVAFGFNLGGIGLVDETEPLFAEAARQMTVTGDWVTPYFNDTTRFDKPPLVYWLMAIAYQTIGVNEWAVRLPSALAAVGLTGMGFFTLRFFGFARPNALQTLEPSESAIAPMPVSPPVERQLWLAAWIGAAVMALNPQTLVWARTGVSDMLLSGCMGTSLLSFFWAYAQPSRSRRQAVWYFVAYVLAALAVLAKGPVGVVIPGLVVLVFLFYVGRVREVLREMHLWEGSLLFLAITLPWYILVFRDNGQAYIDSFFGYHNFERFTRVVNNHSAPWYFYFVVVLLGFAPWSVYLPVAIARLRFWQIDQWRQQPRTAHLGLFALIWFAVIFGFFTVAVTKLPSYVLPLLPSAAILVGLFWSDQIIRQPSDRATRVTHWINLGFMAAIAGAVFYSANWMGNDPAMPDFPEAMQQSGILVGGGLIWLIAGLIGASLLLRRQGAWLWCVNLCAFGLFVVFTIVPTTELMDSHRQLPLRQLSATVTQVQQPNELLIMVGFPKPSVVFYAQRPFLFAAPQNALNRPQRRANRSRQPVSALVLGHPRRIAELPIDPDQYELIEESGAYQLVRVTLSNLDLAEDAQP